MKIKSANGVRGCLLNPYHKEGGWTFRVYDYENHTHTDYDLCHSDLFVMIDDADAFFYKDSNGPNLLDHSPATLGKEDDASAN